MTQTEALSLALEALTDALNKPMWNRVQMESAITAIKAALEAKDGPVAWGYRDRNGEITDCITPHEHARAEGDYRIPLYSTPPQRTWVGLTYEEIWACLPKDPDEMVFARAIEEKLKEKNA